MTPAPKRRWFKFSLRTLFVVMTVVAATLGWLSWRFEQARERRTIMIQYLRAGAGFGDTDRDRREPLFWEFFGDVGPIMDIELPSDKFTEADQRRLQSIFPEIPVIIVDRTPYTAPHSQHVDWAEAHPYLWSD